MVGVVAILLEPGGEVLGGVALLHVGQVLLELGRQLVNRRDTALGNLVDIGHLDDVVTVLALHGSSNDLILLKAGQSVLVLGDEGAQRVPAHIAAVSSGAGVGGILGGGILEGDLAGVDLIEQLLGAGGQSGVVLAFLGGQQDVARALSAVELLAHGLGLGERSVVALSPRYPGQPRPRRASSEADSGG